MDDLSMLLPGSRCPTEQKRPSQSKTGHLLEALATRLLQHISNHEFDHPDFHVLLTDNYAAYQEYSDAPLSRTREEYLANYRAFAAANPNYAIEPISLSADVDEEAGMATLWMHIRVKGHPPHVWRESVTVSYWRRKDQRWIAYRQNGIRGVGWYQ